MLLTVSSMPTLKSSSSIEDPDEVVASLLRRRHAASGLVAPMLAPGDHTLITPSRSKTDQFGEVHSPFPSVALFDPGRVCNPGEALRDIEMQQPCRSDLTARVASRAWRREGRVEGRVAAG